MMIIYNNDSMMIMCNNDFMFNNDSCSMIMFYDDRVP